MAKKKSTKNFANIDTSRIFSGDKSYMSLAYGVITVVVIFIIIFLGVRAISQRNVEVTEEATQTQQERTYMVKDGDNLWTIAEEVYNDGYKWTLIAEENNLDSPDAISTGMSLKIPEATEEAETTAMNEGSEEAAMTEEDPAEATATTAPTVAPTMSPTKAAATQAPAVGGQGAKAGASYTIAEGDNLWVIAVAAYNDGYRWVEIAKANNIVNPDLIYAGDKLTLPR